MKKNDLIKMNNQLPKNLDKMVPAMTSESGHIYTADKGVVPINTGIFEGFDFSINCDMDCLNNTLSNEQINNKRAFNNTMRTAIFNKIKNITDMYEITINSRMRVLVIRTCAALNDYINPNSLYKTIEETCSRVQTMTLGRYVITIRNMILSCYCYNNNISKGDISVCLNGIYAEMNSACMDINNTIWCDLLNRTLVILPEKEVDNIMNYYTSEFAKFMYDMLYETMVFMNNIGNTNMGGCTGLKEDDPYCIPILEDMD